MIDQIFINFKGEIFAFIVGLFLTKVGSLIKEKYEEHSLYFQNNKIIKENNIEYIHAKGKEVNSKAIKKALKEAL